MTLYNVDARKRYSYFCQFDQKKIRFDQKHKK